MRADPRSDEHLVQQALAGSADAWEVLVDRYHPWVRGIVRRYLRNAADAEDVVQETFMRCFQGLPRLRAPARFRPWVAEIARCSAIDRARRMRHLVDGSDELPDVPDERAGPPELTELVETLRALRVALRNLTPRDATILSLVTELGFTPAQVGAAMGITPNAAKVALHRARARLRQQLARELGDVA